MKIEPTKQSKKAFIFDSEESALLSKIKTRIMIKNLIKDIIGNETSQAIIRIIDTKYLGLKLFWLICLLGCVSLCGFLVAQTFIIYLSFPVYTTQP